MKKILFLTLIFSSGIFSFPDKNTFDKSKPIWRNAKIVYVHQYMLDVAFGRVNSYLCLINKTDYQNNSNLGDGIGYKAILNNSDCEHVEASKPWTVVSKQESESADLDIELFKSDQAVDYKIKLNIEEEASDSNPFGVLTIDYSSVFKSNSSPLYNASYESRKLSENQVKFEAAYYMDGVVINNFFYFTSC